MNCSTPGLPVHHILPEFTQTYVHWVGDAIQPSHPLSSPSPPAPNPSSIRVFSNESTLRMRWPKYWSFSFSIIPSKEHPVPISSRMDWLDLLALIKAMIGIHMGTENTGKGHQERLARSLDGSTWASTKQVWHFRKIGWLGICRGNSFDAIKLRCTETSVK